MFASNIDLNVVVVGRVSMNKKKAKRNLQRIATNQREPEFLEIKPTIIEREPEILEIKPTVEVLVASPAPAAAAVPAPKPATTRWADMLSDDEDDFPLTAPEPSPAPVAAPVVAPVAAPALVEEPAPEPAQELETAKKRRTHRGGRSQLKRAEQEQRKLAKKEVVVMATLPDVVLARVFEYVDLAAVGAAAATGRAMRAAVWDSAAFWTHLASDGSISSADGFRKWLFGLQGDWAAAFHAYCTTADPATALGEAAYLAGGLMRSDGQEMGAFVAAVVCAAQRVESDWDAATGALGSIAAKATLRVRVFGTSARGLGEAADGLRERALLAKLAEDEAYAAFDPFEEEEEAVDFDEDAALQDLFAEPKEEPLDQDFAETFLELLDA